MPHDFILMNYLFFKNKKSYIIKYVVKLYYITAYFILIKWSHDN